MRRCLRVVVVFSVCMGMLACGPEASDLSTCQNARFKLRLCEVDEYPVSNVCGDTLSEAERCRAECWYDAPCEDLALSAPSPDVQDCIDDCVGSEGRFTCSPGHQIPASWVCDGRVDCPADGGASDESDCGS